MRAPMDFLQCRHQIGEGVAFAGDGVALKFPATIDHLGKKNLEIGQLHLATPSGRSSTGEKPTL